jgi:homocitrate synthase
MSLPKLINILDQISFSDTTQREGRQSEGAHLTPQVSIDHAKLVNSIGIDYLELNHPASSPVLGQLVKDIFKLKLKTKIATHVRCNLRDIQTAIDAGTNCINTYIPINPDSSADIRNSIQIAQNDLTLIAPILSQKHIELRVSVEHALSLPLPLLRQVYRQITTMSCVKRVGLAETSGVCFPDRLQKYAAAIYQVIPENVPIQFHLHNDHGLVAANFLQILKLLAKNGRRAVFDISVAGFGERNGILSHGDVFSILYLINQDKLKARYQIKHYASLVKLIEESINLPLCRRDPLNPWAFSHSAGPHVDGMINGHNPYQAITPEDFGFKLKLNVGHCVTGYKGLQAYAKTELKQDLNDDLAKQIAADVRQRASLSGPLSNKQLNHLISVFLKNP